MASLAMLSFLIKAKFRRKYFYLLLAQLFFLFLCLKLVICHSISAASSSSCGDILCIHGTCQDGKCICDRGWQGSACHRCGGRIRLDSTSGYITDGIGNYSTDLQCTWLIDSGVQNATIRLQIVQFETECSWDHLYIFDGDSVFATLIAAYSGLLVKDGQVFQRIPEIVANSGKAYLYFYSDAAYNMSGFNISYHVNTCPKNCSGHGVCIGNSQCTCDAGWDGEACDIMICPNDCNGRGKCDKEYRRCVCDREYTGLDCSQTVAEGYWSNVEALRTIHGRSLHQAVIHEHIMWIVGGEYIGDNPSDFLMKFDMRLRKWDVAKFDNSPPIKRFGHSVVVYHNKLVVFGGMFQNGSITDELWVYDVNREYWEHYRDFRNSLCYNDYCPLASMGHTANLIDYNMIVIFGYNPVYGYLNTVQEYNLITRKWIKVETQGAPVKGGYGHSSVYDHITKIIYVYGGYHSFGSSDTVLVDLLYGYNPWQKSWMLLNPSQSPRYLHTAVIINGMMLIYGGNGHNATHDNAGDKCFSTQFLAYEIACDSWRTLKDPSSVLMLNHDIGRYGHTATVYNGSMYVFGGFNGIMLNSLLKFTPGDCYHYTMQDECVKTKPGTSCVWNKEKNICQPYAILKSSTSFGSQYTSPPLYAPCGQNFANYSELCQRQTMCPTCLENTYGCVWCGDTCHISTDKCRKSGIKEEIKGVRDISRCEDDVRNSKCDKLHNCHACHTEKHCGWQRDHKCYTYIREIGSNRTEKVVIHNDLRPTCEAPCDTRTTCENCTQGGCMWCSSLRRCIESNAYAAVFPVAQCMEWTIHPWKCSGISCSDIQTCDRCQRNPRCGWCDDGTGTGVGICLEGSSTGPHMWNGSTYSLVKNACPASHWHFASCPECQCNGHSSCTANSNVCQKPCQHLTNGSHCQYCMTGYYGNPVNGGNCTPCFCHNHSAFCNRENGKCHCTTKGIIGHHCDRCDEQNHYFGNPQEEGGSCFYNLTMGYQYTFNMSKPDDRYYTRINFMNVPMTPDIDVEFMIQCTDSALVNISVGSATLPVRTLHDRLECGNFKLRFSHNENLFGIENTTFYVNVFAFSTPFVLQISFSQHRTLDLLQFFVTFSSCFLTLLIIAAILWKVKQKYDLYRRRQQLFVEMEQMASRPFAGVVVQIDQETMPELFPEAEAAVALLKNYNPTPVALEPCATGKAAVLSLIVRLPSGGNQRSPAGQTGLAIASALVSLGSVEQKYKENENKVVVNSSTKCQSPTAASGV